MNPASGGRRHGVPAGGRGLRARLRHGASQLRSNLGACALAARHPRVPWLARFLAIAVLAYAASPIDLIPDFIPVLGLLDDLIVVPLGLWLVWRLIPPAVWAECRARAETEVGTPSPNWIAAVCVVMLWLGAVAVAAWWLLQAR
ncbi:MAG: YkvA family protein [Gammaproteobacteria bacterium]